MPFQFSAKIDWLSLVVRTPKNDDTYTPAGIPPAARKSITAELNQEIAGMVIDGGAALTHGRAPYRWGYKSDLSKATIWHGGQAEHLTIEFPGASCDWIRMLNIEPQMLACGTGNASRVDIAIDIECDLTPIQLTDSMDNGRIKTRSVMESGSGTTVYLGSMKSEHYARVYRYNDPHPRAGLLRVEFVARRNRAKTVCEAILEHGIYSLLKQLWDEVGLPNVLEFDLDNAKVSLNEDRPERDGKNTVSWLIKQAAPAFKRLVREGHISNSEQFLREYFLGMEIAD